MDGSATGVGMLLAGAPDDHLAGGPLGFAGDVAAAASPSWLAAHPSLDVVYAALERVGAVQAYRRTGEASFVPLGPPVPAGEATCHIAVSPDGGSLVASCWGDGRVVRMTLDAAGAPSSPVVAPAAADPYGSGRPGAAAADDRFAAASRALRDAVGDEYADLIPQPGPPAQATDAAARPSRAHQAVFLAGGLIATTDMGLDLVRFWRASPEGLRSAGQVVLPKGSGPRHMVRHASGHLYVVAELSCELFALAPDASGRWRLVGGAQLGGLAGDAAAEVAASRDGGFLYAALRGSNALAAVRVRGSGEALAPVALVESGVDWPRHHVIVRDTLLVAGQLSDEVASLSIDERTGVPGRVRHRTAVPSPTCILPAAA
jgi:6-phosphogluconolactonase (cycloisomerase 2 family)